MIDPPGGWPIEEIAEALLGEPNREMSTRRQLRYGRNGSLAIELAGDKRGEWFDHEAGVGGGPLELVQREVGGANGEAIAWLREQGVKIGTEPTKRIVATYAYRDETGAVLFEVVRFEPKTFRQRRPNGTWSVKGVRQVPYRLPELLERPEGASVYIVEGEKDVDRLRRLGVVATCNAGGAGGWRAELNRHFAGADVVVLPDNDEPGRAHAAKVARGLRDVAASVRIVELPGLAPKGDVSDWIDAGGSVEDLQALVERAPAWDPEAADPDAFVAHDAEELDAGAIPPREWLLGRIVCRGYLTVLAAAGGSGKTTLLLAWALSLAAGRSLLNEYVYCRSRVLIVTLEDDLNECRRRLRAARRHHGVSGVGGWLYVLPLAGKDVALARAAAAGLLEETDVAARLLALIRKLRVDVVIFDPLVKLGAGDENDNRAADFLARVLVRLAAEAKVAVVAAHHFRKGSAAPGDIAAARGASAIIDAARLTFTLTRMSEAEADELDVPAEERPHLVRLDDGKVNLAPPAQATRWYRLVSIELGNGTDAYPNGDSVQAIERWAPPDFWRELSASLLNRVLDQIDAGLPDGERYSGAPQAKVRGAWRAVMEHAPWLSDKQARKVVATWLRSGVLYERDYQSTVERREFRGLYVNPAKRPG
jgi:hypothetical protein